MIDKNIIIVGAGPAGMMAAIRASELGSKVILIEKNSYPGKKLLLSGKWRCNLTNACDFDLFLERFSKNGQFLRDAFRIFFNKELMDFFQKRGLKLKIERQMRVFPNTDRAASILEVLRKELQKNKVKIIQDKTVKDVIVQDEKIKGVLLSDGEVLSCDRVILATGGLSYSFTGSTGEGVRIAGKLGHSIIKTRPGLVPLVVQQNYPKFLEGLTLKNISIRFVGIAHKNNMTVSKKEINSEIGELLFTDRGVSGPLVLSLSGTIVDWLLDGFKVYIEIDLKPALTREQLDARLLREFKANSKKNMDNAIKTLLPYKLIGLFLNIIGIPADKKASHVNQQERQKIISLLKSFRLDIKSANPLEDAMVTRGGVSLKSINPRTMESRLIKGLYFAGEMIDIDADTGGFNLQAAFSTGYLAGQSACS